MFRLTTTARIASKAIVRQPVFVRADVMNYSSASEGATGSGYSRAGGEQAGDSFTKREKAAEELYVREQEKEKLRALRLKLQKQREHLDELDKHIEEFTREQGKSDK